MKRPIVLFRLLAALSAGIVCAAAHDDHDIPPGQKAAAGAAPLTAGAIRSGTGAFRYEFMPDKVPLPASVKMRHAHGLCHDQQGYIYFTYEPSEVTDETRVLIRFDPDGTHPQLLGTNNALAFGAPHGLSIGVDPDGSPWLYHANNDATVSKTALDGDIAWTRKWPAFMGNYKPTDAVVPPGSSRVFVADGYGSSMIHALKRKDGVYDGKSWGGAGPAHGELNCPHGIAWDPRRQLLLIADRGNQRLEYFTTNGLYHSTVTAPEIKAPCNADIRGDFVLVPNLDGPLVILDQDNRTVSVVEVGRLLGAQGFAHPHDAIFLPNGDLVVGTWNPGRLGYWRKLPPE